MGRALDASQGHECPSLLTGDRWVYRIKAYNKLDKKLDKKSGGKKMLAVNYSTIRNHLKDYCDKVTDEHETVIVTRKDEKNVVLLSLEKYNEVMRAARNAEYLDMIDRSMEQAKNGKVVVKTMAELEDMADG